MATRIEQPRAAGQMAETCARFLDSLAQDQKAKATFQYVDGERVFWLLSSIEPARPSLARHGPTAKKIGPGLDGQWAGGEVLRTSQTDH